MEKQVKLTKVNGGHGWGGVSRPNRYESKPNEVKYKPLQPCVAVTGSRLPRAKKPRAERDFGDCGGHHNGGGGGGDGGGGYGRRFAPSARGGASGRGFGNAFFKPCS